MSSSKGNSLPSHLKLNERSSSKRALEREQLEKSIKSDTVKVTETEKDITTARKKIKSRGSFDGEYWAGHRVVAQLQVEKAELQHKISKSSFLLDHDNEKDFDNSEEAKQLRESQAAAEIVHRILKEHSEKLVQIKDDELLITKQHLLELLISLPAKRGGVGLGEVMGQGRREPEVQAEFRKKLVEACNSRHEEDTFSEYLYCPILGGWVHETATTAAHIFPYGAGQTLMDKFFGREHEDKPEMFEIQNGLIMSTAVETKIASGLVALVPGVRENASNEEVDTWKETHPRSYKIHVFQPTTPAMKKPLPPYFISDGTPQVKIETWADLHGRKVDFRSDHRPRARYLYWQWMIGLLKATMQVNHRMGNPISKEFGKRFWGTGGKWIKEKFLQGFAEFAGHTFEGEPSLEAAGDTKTEDIKEADHTAALAALLQLRGGFLKMPRNLYPWEDSDDEDWD